MKKNRHTLPSEWMLLVIMGWACIFIAALSLFAALLAKAYHQLWVFGLAALFAVAAFQEAKEIRKYYQNK